MSAISPAFYEPTVLRSFWALGLRRISGSGSCTFEVRAERNSHKRAQFSSQQHLLDFAWRSFRDWVERRVSVNIIGKPQLEAKPSRNTTPRYAQQTCSYSAGGLAAVLKSLGE